MKKILLYGTHFLIVSLLLGGSILEGAAAACSSEHETEHQQDAHVVAAGNRARRFERYGPLHNAAVLGDTAEVQRLLDEGVDVNSRDADHGRTALHVAAVYGDGRPDIVAMLLARGANPYAPDNKGLTASYLASCCDHWDVLEKFFAAKVDLTRAETDSGRTILHAAAVCNSWVTMTKLLTCRIVDPNVVNHDGHTPLHLAAQRNGIRAIQLLITHGARTNLQSAHGNTPLHEVSCHVYDYAGLSAAETTQILLHAGAPVDIQNRDGDTALHLAVKRHHFLRTEALLLSGAKSDIKNNAGKTAVDIAKELKCRKVLQVIERFFLDGRPLIDLVVTE